MMWLQYLVGFTVFITIFLRKKSLIRDDDRKRSISFVKQQDRLKQNDRNLLVKSKLLPVGKYHAPQSGLQFRFNLLIFYLFYYTCCIPPKRETSLRYQSPLHCARALQLLLKKCACSNSEPLVTLCPIWPARDLNLRVQRQTRFRSTNSKKLTFKKGSRRRWLLDSTNIFRDYRYNLVKHMRYKYL